MDGEVSVTYAELEIEHARKDAMARLRERRRELTKAQYEEERRAIDREARNQIDRLQYAEAGK